MTTPEQQLKLAWFELLGHLETLQADRAARLEVIQRLEATCAERLALIQRLDAELRHDHAERERSPAPWSGSEPHPRPRSWTRRWRCGGG